MRCELSYRLVYLTTLLIYSCRSFSVPGEMQERMQFVSDRVCVCLYSKALRSGIVNSCHFTQVHELREFISVLEHRLQRVRVYRSQHCRNSPVPSQSVNVLHVHDVSEEKRVRIDSVID
jgi:hypothetical protein